MAAQLNRGRALAGITMVIAGVGVLVMLVIVNNCLSAVCQRALFSIGLAGAAALSAIAQVMAGVGAWLFWTALRHEKKP